jgi:enoyl-CoA hydratase/carnithine racemase
LTEQVKATLSDGVLRIQFDRPEKKNALTTAMYETIAGIMESAQGDAKVRVLFFTGTDDCFTSGNDIADFLGSPQITEDSPVSRFLNILADGEKPMVAAVRGPAIGVGTTMLLHFDLVYAGASALFQLPFVNLALVPEAGSTLLLPKLAGYQKAAELILLGEPFGATEAREIGLVAAVMDDQGVEKFAMEKALALATKPPAALRRARALLKGGRDSLDEVMIAEGKAFAKGLLSEEAQEAMQAFMEHRQPDFSKF